MAIAVLIATLIGLIISLGFNALQYHWRQQDRQDRAVEKAEQRRREEAPPKFYALNGNPGPMRISGVQHSVQGPFMDVFGNVTVVNPTNTPMKISFLRLVLGGEECSISTFFFRFRSNSQTRFERISLKGNDKEDYEMHFMFPDSDYPMPPPRDGELWLSSDNRSEPFAIPVSCP
jgi:hypothetical protein